MALPALDASAIHPGASTGRRAGGTVLDGGGAVGLAAAAFMLAAGRSIRAVATR